MLDTIKNYIVAKRDSKPISFFKTKKRDSLTALGKYAEIGKLSTGILHDILNPLSSLLLSINTFGSVRSEDDLKKYLEVVTRSGKQMEDLIMLVKAYSNNSEEVSDVSLNESIKNIMLLVKYYALKNNISFIFATSEDIKLKCNHLSLYQVLMNIISNAIESYRDVDMKNKKIVLETKCKNKYAYITVRDYGKGIERKDINRIFKPFYSTRKSCGGSGIGLSTVKYILENKLKGNIKVKSEPNNGSLFTVMIPR
ncbi:MAG: signal transduction histidine kinase [Candidatus Paceibacteria bacterium]|jgi:signal transduction histidine kinase